VPEESRRHRLPTWAKYLLAVCAVVPLVVMTLVILVPLVLRAKAQKGERTALASLKSIAAAEEAFRRQDSDSNGVLDYWTGDVAGLRGIDPGIARSDLEPLAEVSLPAAHSGNWFRALIRDGARDEAYGQDTDGSGRRVHHRDAFGFAALPEPGRYQPRVFVINESNAILFRAYEGDVLRPGTPRPTGSFAAEWPGPTTSRLWRKMP